MFNNFCYYIIALYYPLVNTSFTTEGLNLDIGKKIKLLRISHNMTQEELSEKVDVSVTSVRCWEYGSKLPSANALGALSKVFNTSTDELLGLTYYKYHNESLDISDHEAALIRDYRSLDKYGKEAVDKICSIEKERVTSKDQSINSDHSNIRQIPKFLLLSAAGYAFPFSDESEFDMITVDESVPVAADFAVKIQGNSMYPYICDGDIVYVSKDSELSNGDVGIFSVDGAMYCKQLYKKENGDVILASANEDLKDSNVILSNDSSAQFQCYGKVLLNRKLKLPNYLFQK